MSIEKKTNTTHGIKRRTFMMQSAAVTAGCSLPFAVTSQEVLANPNTPADLLPQSGETMSWNACLVNCGSRCVLRAFTNDGKVTRIETDNTGKDIYGDHQIRACLRGRSMRKRIHSEERLLYPMKRVGKRGEGKFERISWDEALDTVAEKLKQTIAKYGNEAVYLQYGSGTYQMVNGGRTAGTARRLLNLLGGHLDYYGTYSTAQISAAAPYTFGGSPGSYLSQVSNSKLVVMFGNNTMETRASGGGLSYELYHALKESNARLVIIDPRYCDTALGKETQWIAIRPGTDAALVEGMAYVLITENLVDQAFLDQYCVGYDNKTLPESAPVNSDYKSYILGQGEDQKPKTPQWASEITGIPVATIIQLARDIGQTKPCFIAQGWGPQRQANGEQTSRAIPMLALLTGNIGLPGTNTGLREGDASLGEASMPMGTNPVKTKISVFTWTDAIARGTEMTALKDGVRGADKLSVPIKFMFVTQSNALINQHSQTDKTHEILQDDSKCEFILVVDNQMTASARYADILLPDVTSFEVWDLAADGYASGTMTFMVSLQPAIAPLGEARPFYNMCAEIAKRFGKEQEFTEGRATTGEWAEYLYNETRKKYPEQLPDYETFKQIGVVRVHPKGDNSIALKAFREDPQANPLKTPSGKIEIYSERLAKIAQTWDLPAGDVITPLPQYVTTWESHLDPKTKDYPLQLIGYHFKGRAHSTYHNIDWLRKVAPDEVWINPIDAAPRNIKSGDLLHVYNERGTVQIAAKVTPRIIPGVVAIPQGAWYQPKNGVDVGACINTLTTHRTSPLAKGNPQHTNLVEIKKI